MVKGKHVAPGVIAEIIHPSDETAVCLTIKLDSGEIRGFGGDCLTKEGVTAFLQGLCETLEVATPQKLVGTYCYALKSFSDWDDKIEGLESPSGDRFTLTGFMSRNLPGRVESPLTKRKELLSRELEAVRRRSMEIEAKLATLAADYIDWSRTV